MATSAAGEDPASHVECCLELKFELSRDVLAVAFMKLLEHRRTFLQRELEPTSFLLLTHHYSLTPTPIIIMI